MQKSEGKKLEANGLKTILRLLNRSVQKVLCPGLEGQGLHSISAVARNILSNQGKSSYAKNLESQNPEKRRTSRDHLV